MQDQSGRKCSFTIEKPAESAGNLPAESADYELATNIHSGAAPQPSSKPAPAQPEIQDDSDGGFTRIHDDDLTARQWDSERGDFVPAPSPRTRTPAPAIEQTRAQIVSLQERRSA